MVRVIVGPFVRATEVESERLVVTAGKKWNGHLICSCVPASRRQIQNLRYFGSSEDVIMGAQIVSNRKMCGSRPHLHLRQKRWNETMKKTILLMVLLVVTVPPPTYGQAPSLTDDPRVKSALTLLETWLQAEQEYEQIPGISMGIGVRSASYLEPGVRLFGSGRQDPGDPETIYSICSISKLFTSVSMMQLPGRGEAPPRRRRRRPSFLV